MPSLMKGSANCEREIRKGNFDIMSSISCNFSPDTATLNTLSFLLIFRLLVFAGLGSGKAMCVNTSGAASCLLINQPRQSQLKSNSSSDNRKLTRLNPSKRRFGYASSAAAMEQFAVKFYGFFTKANRSAFANVCCAVCDAVAQLPVKLAVTIIANSITRRLYAVMLHFNTLSRLASRSVWQHKCSQTGWLAYSQRKGKHQLCQRFFAPRILQVLVLRLVSSVPPKGDLVHLCREGISGRASGSIPRSATA
jgi:hypothetical protein